MPKKKTSIKKNSALPKLLFTKKCSEIPTKKRWDSYADYLKSPEWKQVKKEFRKNYPGRDNTCEITGIIFTGEDKQNLHFHHFRYPADWNNDSGANLVLICKEVHDFIHGSGEFHNRILLDEEKEDRTIFRTALICDYNTYIHQKIFNDNKKSNIRKEEIDRFCQSVKQLKENHEKELEVFELKIAKDHNTKDKCLELAFEEIDRLKGGSH